MDVEVQVASDASGIPPADDISEWVQRAAGAAGDVGEATVSVRIVDEEEMHRLNRDYRAQDKPTNVLSFPAGDIDGLPAGEAVMLGDM